MNKHVLIVEDSPTQALQAQILLEDVGYQVSLAENGRAGLQNVAQIAPDLIITDVNMPMMDGYEMTRQLKSDPRTEQIPVLMLTSLNQPLDVIRGLEAGADHFVTKPYNEEYLLQRIKDLFDSLEKNRSSKDPRQEFIQHLNQEIVITHSREQVLQALLQASSQMMNCEVIALLLCQPDNTRTHFVISFTPLEKAEINRLGHSQAELLARVRKESEVIFPTQIIPISTHPASPQNSPQGDLLESHLNAPLLINGRVMGILGMFSSQPDAFDLKQIGILFEMGQKTAQAFSRMKV